MSFPLVIAKQTSGILNSVKSVGILSEKKAIISSALYLYELRNRNLLLCTLYSPRANFVVEGKKKPADDFRLKSVAPYALKERMYGAIVVVMSVLMSLIFVSISFSFQ